MKIEHTPITGKEDKDSLSLPLRAVSEFYDAFNNKNLEKISSNWAHTEEVVAQSPAGGITRGWEAIESVYKRIFSSPATVNAEFDDYTLQEMGEIFYVIGRERVELKVNETVVEVRVRISRIYRMIGGRWRQVHLHGSIDEPELLAQYQKAVRGDV